MDGLFLQCASFQAKISDYFKIIIKTLDAIYNFSKFKLSSIKDLFNQLYDKDQQMFQDSIIRFFAYDGELKNLLLMSLKLHLDKREFISRNDAIIHCGFGQIKISNKPIFL